MIIRYCCFPLLVPLRQNTYVRSTHICTGLHENLYMMGPYRPLIYGIWIGCKEISTFYMLFRFWFIKFPMAPIDRIHGKEIENHKSNQK